MSKNLLRKPHNEKDIMSKNRNNEIMLKYVLEIVLGPNIIS